MRLSVLGSLAFSGLFLSQLALGQAITEFPVSSPPSYIVSGPDGNLWFTPGFPGIGKISTSGVVTQVPIGNSDGAGALVFDKDGNLWFAEGTNSIARMSSNGEIVSFTLPGTSFFSITVGADGNLWFSGLPATAIGKITSSGSVSQYPLSSNPYAVTAGPDGNIWFTEFGNGIGKITPSGVVTEFSVPGNSFPQSPNLSNITAGPDGALWFTDMSDDTGKIGRITTSGAISEFTIPDFQGIQQLGGITSGPDGAIWFTESSAPFPFAPPPPPSKVGRIAPDGTITEVLLPTTGSYPFGITTGPDGNLWAAERNVNKIARITPTAALCANDANTMCLVSGRFRVSVTWQSPIASGTGTSNPLTSNTGAFWFFDPTNLELVIKVLDGREIDGHFWVFYGSLTNVEFTLIVTDTQTGAVKTYLNPQGTLASVADTSAF
jgi:virginiamycin B lyase